MKEYTNGALPPVVFDDDSRHGRLSVTLEAHCPYCGWTYDQPETLIPAHASCGHLVAVSQSSPFWRQLNGAAVLDTKGSWLKWNTAADGDIRRSLEKAFSGVSVKIDSSTASIPLYDSDLATCRYYFSRRPTEIAAQVEGLQTVHPIRVIAPASHADRPSDNSHMCCRC